MCVHESGSRPKFFWMPSRVEFQVGGKIAAERTWQRAECHLEQCAFKSVKRTILLILDKKLAGELHTSLKSLSYTWECEENTLDAILGVTCFPRTIDIVKNLTYCFNTIHGGMNLLIRKAWQCA